MAQRVAQKAQGHQNRLADLQKATDGVVDPPCDRVYVWRVNMAQMQPAAVCVESKRGKTSACSDMSREHTGRGMHPLHRRMVTASTVD